MRSSEIGKKKCKDTISNSFFSICQIIVKFVAGITLRESKCSGPPLFALQVERQVNGEIEAWEQANGREFYVRGARFTDYIRAQWDDYHRQKDSEKHERVSDYARPG